MKEFLAEYKASGLNMAIIEGCCRVGELTGEKVDDSFKAKLQQKQQKAKEQNGHINHHKRMTEEQGNIRGSGVGNCSAFILYGKHKNRWRNGIS